MSTRRRRRDRRGRRSDHPEPPEPAKAPAKRADVRRRAAFEARMARMQKLRSVVALLTIVPLGASLLCGALPGAALVCSVPKEVYLGLWAAIFGTFIGLTFRIWRERRSFERSGAAA